MRRHGRWRWRDGGIKELHGLGVRSFSIRDFTRLPLDATITHDAGPEGITFISADDSPIGKPIVVTGSEVSGPTTLYVVDVVGK